MTLTTLLIVAAALIGIGIYGTLSQQSFVMLMMGLELIINGAMLAAVSFWALSAAGAPEGQLLTIVAMAVMAIEMAMGFALVGFVGVMQLIILARDLLSLLIAWEIAGAFSWLLIGHRFQDPERGRNASQAFLVTRAGDLGLYLAAFIAFQQTGSLAYAGLDQMSPVATSLFVAGVTVAAFSKSAQLPFSPWLFAAMSGPASVSALLHAATMVAAGVVLLMQLQPMLADVSWFGPVLIIVGLATALTGGLVAVASPHAKRLLAGSTSAHYGLMFVAIGAGYPVVALLHFALHAVMKAQLFMVAGIAGHQAGSYNLSKIARVRLPDGLIYTSAIAALALAGLFPLGAAWTKEGVVSVAGVIAPWLAIVVMLAGGLSAVYAARFQWNLFPHPKEKQPESPPTFSSGWQQHGPLYVLAVLVLSGSVLWLPTVNHELGVWLAASFPGITLSEFVVSMALVLLGLFAAYRMVTTELGQGEHRLSAGRDFLARWLFLPQLAQRFVVMPVDALSRYLATLDDKAVDAVVRAGARFALWLASVGGALITTAPCSSLWRKQSGCPLWVWAFASRWTVLPWLSLPCRRCCSRQP